MLWIFGTADPVIPVNASVAELEEIAADTDVRHDIVMLENSDHNFVNVETGKSFDLVPVIRPWLQSLGIIDDYT